MAPLKTLLPLIATTLSLLFSNARWSESQSFARPGELRASQAFAASPAVHLLHNDSLRYGLLVSPNGAAEFSLLLLHNTPAGKPTCTTAVLNATAHIMWMRPCPPLAYSNCSLAFTAAGEILLAVNGVDRWSSNTSAMGVGGLSLNNKSDLQILNKNNQSVWNSHADPTPAACLAQFEPPAATSGNNGGGSAACQAKEEDSSASPTRLASGFLLNAPWALLVYGLLL